MKWASRVLPLFVTCLSTSLSLAKEDTFEIVMPGVKPKMNDDYICASFRISPEKMWITSYQPNADAQKAHHMLLFYCDDVSPEYREGDVSWDCGHHGVCVNGKIMFAWARNAPPLRLPQGVGYLVEGEGKRLVLQVHYAKPLDEPDRTSIVMSRTSERQPFQAGIYLLMSGVMDIPPQTQEYHTDVNCRINEGTHPFTPFAFRAHAHALGVAITGYVCKKKGKDTCGLMEFARGNPKWPQAFYPIEGPSFAVEPGDVMAARCTYNSTGRAVRTRVGGTANDEMCNLYVMYYTDGPETYGGCGGENVPEITASLPKDSVEPPPFNALLEEAARNKSASSQETMTYTQKGEASKKNKKGDGGGAMISASTLSKDGKTGKQLGATGGLQVVENWPAMSRSLGQVTAVSLDREGNVVVFHRADRVWGGDTFDHNNKLRGSLKRPIADNTVLTLSPGNGDLIHEWGENLFHMPHGLTVDNNDNVWLTDVGLHQVFKFGRRGGNGTALLTLGTKFEPGNDDSHFCKPTAVAVDKNGKFYVADGYCNNRILMYTADGRKIDQTEKPSTFTLFGISLNLGSSRSVFDFSIPHALTLTEDKVCVADRENGRVVCLTHELKEAAESVLKWSPGQRIFSVDYCRSTGSLYAVNGMTMSQSRVQGFVLNLSGRSLESTFSPHGEGFNNPHDVAVTADGSAVYVVEISPYKIWKFVQNKSHFSTKKYIQASRTSEDPSDQKFKLSQPWTWSASVVIVSLLAVPVLVLVILVAVLRLRKRGSLRPSSRNGGVSNGYRSKGSDKFNIGSFLNQRRGFEKLSMEESDHDGEIDSGSDIEEFSLGRRPASQT